MQIFRKLEDVPESIGPTVLSVGNFDGVHRAHTHVLRQIVQRAKEQGKVSMAVTFEPHPARVLRPDLEFKLITPGTEKIKLLEATGVDAVLLLPFTDSLSLLSPQEFASDILKKKLHATEVHEGENFHFGHKASGDGGTLETYGRKMDFEVKLYSAMRVRGAVVSSSQIRTLLENGEVERARHFLGRAFSLSSGVSKGRGYGSKYTVPTINLSGYEELAPRNGVYITQTRVAEECFNSVTNVGNRPTFDDPSFVIESHLLNFHAIDMSDDTEIKIYFLKRLRDEIKFPSVSLLREQIARDVRLAERYFGLLAARTKQENS